MKNLKNAFILGNGSSRRIIDPARLKGDTWGCNAIYRDFKPTHLVVNKQFSFVEDTIQYGNRFINTGEAAIYYALERGYDRLYLIGFDLRNFDDPADCNIYAGSPEYEHYNSRTDFMMSNEVLKRFEQLFFRDYDKFVRVINTNTHWIPYEFSNIKHIDYEELINDNELYERTS